MSKQWEKMENQWDFFADKNFKHEYSPRHMYGQDGVDYQERVNFPRMREYKLERLRWAMKKHDIDAMLLNIGDNVRYATGIWDQDWKSNNNTRYALVFHDTPPILFETVGMDAHGVLLHAPWMENKVYPAITYKFAAKGYVDVAGRYWEQIAEVCKENGVDIKKGKAGY